MNTEIETKEFLDAEGVKIIWDETKTRIQDAVDTFNEELENIKGIVSGVEGIDINYLNTAISTNAQNINTLSQLIGDSETGLTKDILNLQEEDENISEEIEPILPLKNMYVYFPHRILNGGDCSIIRIPDSSKASGYSIVVIDLGVADASEEFVDFLNTYNINHIDKIIITHYHTDHVGGTVSRDSDGKFIDSSLITLYDLAASGHVDESTEFILPHNAITLTNTSTSDLIGDFAAAVSFHNQIKNFVKSINNDSLSTIHYPYIMEDGTKNYTTMTIGDAYFEFFNIDEASLKTYKDIKLGSSLKMLDYPNYNNYSMITQLTYGDKLFLFTGDIEEGAQKKIHNKIKNPDVLKVEHHDFNYRAYISYIKKLTPQYAIVCDYATTDCMPYDQKLRRASFTALNNIAEIYHTNTGSVTVKTNGRTISATGYGGRDNIYGDISLISATGFPEEAYLSDITSSSTYWCDINKVRIPGTYFIQTSAVAQKVKNVPCDDSGFKLIVEYLNPGATKTIRQTFIKSSDSDEFVLHRTGRYDSSTSSIDWNRWTTMTPFVKGIDIIAGTPANNKYKNLNNCIDLVTYSCSDPDGKGITNAPDTSGFTLNVHQISTNRLMQVVFSNSKRMYFRTVVLSNGAFSSASAWGYVTTTNV